MGFEARRQLSENGSTSNSSVLKSVLVTVPNTLRSGRLDYLITVLPWTLILITIKVNKKSLLMNK